MGAIGDDSVDLALGNTQRRGNMDLCAEQPYAQVIAKLDCGGERIWILTLNFLSMEIVGGNEGGIFRRRDSDVPRIIRGGKR